MTKVEKEWRRRGRQWGEMVERTTEDIKAAEGNAILIVTASIEKISAPTRSSTSETYDMQLHRPPRSRVIPNSTCLRQEARCLKTCCTIPTSSQASPIAESAIRVPCKKSSLSKEEWPEAEDGCAWLIVGMTDGCRHHVC